MQYLTADANNIGANETQSFALVAKWINAGGYAADVFPCDRPTAAAILAVGAGYDCDAEELDRLAELGMIPDLAGYDARDLVAIASCLEGRRAWQFQSVHQPKFTSTAAILEAAREEGPEAVAQLREAVGKTDLAFLLILITECDSRELREKLMTSIRVVLEADHDVRI